MAVTSLTQEFTSPVAPSRIFKGVFIDSPNLLPKIIPDRVKSIEGEGGAGSIVTFNIIRDGEVKQIKNKIDVLDTENYYCKYTFFEGEGLGDKIVKTEFEVKFEPSADGGSVWKMTSHHHAKAGVELDKEELKVRDERAIGLSKAVEAYLIAHPEVYA